MNYFNVKISFVDAIISRSYAIIFEPLQLFLSRCNIVAIRFLYVYPTNKKQSNDKQVYKH